MRGWPPPAGRHDAPRNELAGLLSADIRPAACRHRSKSLMISINAIRLIDGTKTPIFYSSNKASSDEERNGHDDDYLQAHQGVLKRSSSAYCRLCPQAASCLAPVAGRPRNRIHALRHAQGHWLAVAGWRG